MGGPQLNEHELDEVIRSSSNTEQSLPEHYGKESVAMAEVPPDGIKRSNFRIASILTALYVSKRFVVILQKTDCIQLSLFIAALDATIVSTAIPTISRDLHSAAGYTWIGGAYLLANAAFGPIWAKLSDIFGRKPIFLAAVAIFMASSIVCALAKNMEMLIVGRAIQGGAGGGLTMMVNIAISDLFSQRQRSLWLGLCEGVWAIAGGLGPILGGVFTQLVSWRWCWWVNLVRHQSKLDKPQLTLHLACLCNVFRSAVSLP